MSSAKWGPFCLGLNVLIQDWKGPVAIHILMAIIEMADTDDTRHISGIKKIILNLYFEMCNTFAYLSNY